MIEKKELVRKMIVFWDCDCPKELGETPRVETKLVSVTEDYNPYEMEQVVMTGFIERCSYCKKTLGNGYGDIHSFKTEHEKNKFLQELESKKGIWI